MVVKDVMICAPFCFLFFNDVDLEIRDYFYVLLPRLVRINEIK